MPDRFALVIDGLCRAVAARMAKNPASVLLLMVVWTRLRRMAVRFARLAAQAAAGALPHRRAGMVRPRNPARLPRPRQRLPERFAWLVGLAPEAASYGGQLRQLLSEPEMAALLEAAPQVGRILRPLCRMLAVDPAATPPPPKQTPAAAEPAETFAVTPGRCPSRSRGPHLPGMTKSRLRGAFAGLPPPALV